LKLHDFIDRYHIWNIPCKSWRQTADREVSYLRHFQVPCIPAKVSLLLVWKLKGC